MNNNKTWTSELVEKRLIEAADTLRRMSDREWGWLYKSKTYWPDVKQTEAEIFSNAVENGGLHAAMEEPYVPAARDAIGRYWETVDWYKFVKEPADRKITWAVAVSLTRPNKLVSWGMVKNSTGIYLHYTTLARRYKSAVDDMVRGLNYGPAK
jgi:hypothetical protein